MNSKTLLMVLLTWRDDGLVSISSTTIAQGRFLEGESGINWSRGADVEDRASLQDKRTTGSVPKDLTTGSVLKDPLLYSKGISVYSQEGQGQPIAV